jgi:hypothetical protein
MKFEKLDKIPRFDESNDGSISKIKLTKKQQKKLASIWQDAIWANPSKLASWDRFRAPNWPENAFFKNFDFRPIGEAFWALFIFW